MYAKLFSRITESSLMEEAIPTRYAFVMLLAICDPSGHVIGTDVAIARRLNMPVALFRRCAKELAKPDADSNSKEEGGSRIVPSDGERGYRIVNYLKYRDMRDEDQRREYMREYMRRYRGGKHQVSTVNIGERSLAQADVPASEEAESKPTQGNGFVCKRGCKAGFLEAESKCCDCEVGRKRARKMAASYAADREQEKRAAAAATRSGTVAKLGELLK